MNMKEIQIKIYNLNNKILFNIKELNIHHLLKKQLLYH